MSQGLDYVAAADAAASALADSQGTVRLRKRTSNLFRSRAAVGAELDLSSFATVFEVDVVGRTASVGGLTTYEDLVAATLPHGLVPLCVPQLRTITLGGAVTGLGIEAASFRNGCPHESVLGMDVLTGDGQVVRAEPQGEHSDLFFGFPNSYGSLGYALRLDIELEPVKPFVGLRHVRFSDPVDLAAAFERVTRERAFDGVTVDYMDATLFAPDEMYLTLGAYRDHGEPSDYTGQQIYYRSIRGTPCRRSERARLPVALGHRLVLVLVGVRSAESRSPAGVARQAQAQRRLLEDHRGRSPLAAVPAHRPGPGVAHRRRSWSRTSRSRRPACPSSSTSSTARWGSRRCGCVRCASAIPTRRWSLYEFDPDTTYVNVGFWSRVALDAGEDPEAGRVNRRIEAKVAELDGRKSLYSTSFYTREQFYEIYGGHSYTALKARYDPSGRFSDLYDKTCREA